MLTSDFWHQFFLETKTTGKSLRVWQTIHLKLPPSLETRRPYLPGGRERTGRTGGGSCWRGPISRQRAGRHTEGRLWLDSSLLFLTDWKRSWEHERDGGVSLNVHSLEETLTPTAAAQWNHMSIQTSCTLKLSMRLQSLMNSDVW